MNSKSFVWAALLMLASGQLAFAQTSSPFEPPEEKLGVYMVNSGPGLDTGCTFRSGGPLLINLPVPVVVNPNELNSDGTLKDPQKLIDYGVVGAQAVLRMPVWDVDSNTPIPPPYLPELNKVYFNGIFKKIQSGQNNRWTDDSIVIPIGEVRFGQDNLIRIDIDTGNALELWCTAVDWVAVTFDLAAPVVLAHGIGAQADSWDEENAAGVLQALDNTGILYTRFSVTAHGQSAGNAAELQQQIEPFLQSIKADKVHVIAHSKGGLDTQELQERDHEFDILSLSTLSTPHLGSVAADMLLVQKAEANRKINSGEDPNGFASAYINTMTFGQGPQLPGLADLTTYRATEAIGLGLRGNISNTFTIGANADADADNQLSRAEVAGLWPDWLLMYPMERAWRVMRDFSATPVLSIHQEPCIVCWGGSRTVLTYETILAAGPQDNDIVVTTSSANPSYGTALGNSLHNHSTVKNEGNLVLILDQIIPLR